jgi:protein ImuB
MSVSSSRQRILSLWLNRLPTDRLVRQSPKALSPLVIYGKRGNAELIVALDEAAEHLGLSAGLTLAHARAMHPTLIAVAEDTAADAKLLDTIADLGLRYTPLIASDPPDGLLLDIGGCAHLCGGEDRLIADLAARLERAGLAHRIVVTGTIGAAYAAARYGQTEIDPEHDERALLTPLPLAALRLAPQVAAAMGRVGLKRVGDILDLPRAPLTARFGTEVLRQLDRALGREHEPLNPRLPVAPYIAEQHFAEPIAREKDVLGVIARLAMRLQQLLERRGDGARRLELALFRTDGVVRRITAGTSHPLRDPAEIQALFVERLAALADEFDPGFGFDLARLSVAVAEPCSPEQIGLNGGEDAVDVARLVDHLSARLGSARVRRLIALDSHLPEATAASMPAQKKSEDDGWDAFRRFCELNEQAPRPVRMLAKPEPIDAVAEVPDGPPFRFRWRRALHEVVASEGPERIEGAWWNEQGGSLPKSLARDYFRVEDKSGLRFWLFRAGLYRDFVPGGAAPRWFMHGMFA